MATQKHILRESFDHQDVRRCHANFIGMVMSKVCRERLNGLMEGLAASWIEWERSLSRYHIPIVRWKSSE
jgi:hypothetical protein